MGGLRRFAYLTILLIQISLPFCKCSAITRYVSNNGSITPPYTSWETAALFFELAHDISSDGDTIMFASGEFQFHNEILLKKGITLIGRGCDSTVIVGDSSMEVMFWLPNSSAACCDIGFRGNDCKRAFAKFYPISQTVFTATRCKFIDLYDPIRMYAFKRLEVRNCWFEEWGESAAVTAIDSGDVLIENCTFEPPGAAICEFSTSLGERIFRNNVVNSDNMDVLRGDFSFGRLIVSNNLIYGSHGSSMR